MSGYLCLQPAPKRYAFVLGLDPQGRVVENFQDGSSDCYAQIANAVEHGGNLYFGSIGESSIERFALHLTEGAGTVRGLTRGGII